MKFTKVIKAEDYLIDSQIDREDKLNLIDEIEDQTNSIIEDLSFFLGGLSNKVKQHHLSYKQVKQVEEIINEFDFKSIPSLKKNIKNILDNGEYKKL